MSTFIHLMRGQMSKPLDELGGKCPYMPFLDRGQMSEGEHVRPPHTPIVENKNKRTNGPVNAHLRSAVYTNDIENSLSIGADEALGPFFFSE